MNFSVSGENALIELPQGESMALSMFVQGDRTTYTFKAQFAFHPGSPLLLTSGNGITGIALLQPVAGSPGPPVVLPLPLRTTFTLNITTAQSLPVPTASYPWDLWMIDTSNQATRILPGQITIVQRVTPIP